MDTKVSKLKNKMPIPDKYMLIPIGISLIPLTMSFVKYDTDLKYANVVAVILVGVLLFLYFVGFKGSNKLKLKVYSKNSEINYILNKEEKYLNSIVWFITSLTASIIFLFTFSNEFSSSVELFIIYIPTPDCILSYSSKNFSLL